MIEKEAVDPEVRKFIIEQQTQHLVSNEEKINRYMLICLFLIIVSGLLAFKVVTLGPAIRLPFISFNLSTQEASAGILLFGCIIGNLSMSLIGSNKVIAIRLNYHLRRWSKMKVTQASADIPPLPATANECNIEAKIDSLLASQATQLISDAVFWILFVFGPYIIALTTCADVGFSLKSISFIAAVVITHSFTLLERFHLKRITRIALEQLAKDA